MLRLPILICIVLFSPCSTVHNTKSEAEVVNDALKALEAASATADNVFTDFEAFGPNWEKLMKAMVDVNQIFVENPKPEPGSKAYKALKDFGTRSTIILLWKNKISADDLMKEYENKVRTNIQLMKTIKDQYIERTLKYDWSTYQAFDKACTYGELSLSSIMDYLYSRLVVDCRSSFTPEDAWLLAAHRKYLMTALLKMNVPDEPIPDPGRYLSEFVRIHKQLNQDLLKKDFNTFKLHFSNYDEAMHVFLEELRGQITKTNDDPVCLLRELIYKSNYNYSYISEFVTKLLEDLKTLTLIGNTCIEESPYYEDENRNDHKTRVVNKIDLISTHTSKWLNESLRLSWPDAHYELLTEHYMRAASKSDHVDEKALELVSNATNSILKNTGLPNYVHETILIKSENEENDIYHDGIENYCSLRTANGYNTLIGRIPLNSTNNWEKMNVEKRMARLKEYAITLNSTIENEIKNSHGAPTLRDFADALKEKFGEKFISEENFHCWSIVRERSAKIGDPCPRINYWKSYHESANWSSITTLNFRKNGTVSQSCEEFEVIFFA